MARGGVALVVPLKVWMSAYSTLATAGMSFEYVVMPARYVSS